MRWMGRFPQPASTLLLLMLGALAPLRAAAEPVLDRALSGVQVQEENGCALVRIGFNFRVRYLSHFPVEGGKELRVVFQLIDRVQAESQILVRRESLRAPASKKAAIGAIEFELNRAEGPTLLIYFRQSVHYKVSQGADFTSIVIAVSGKKPVQSCTPDFFPTWSSADRRDGAPAPRARAPKPRRPTRELSPEEKKKVAKTMADARAALTKKDLRRAIQLLTKVLSYPENKHSAEAQELLGLARERNGQLAHARAEYEAYLAQYPKGPAADRVRQRLAGIVTARKTPKSKLRKAKSQGGTGRSGRTSEGTTWSVSGSLSQFYFRDEAFRTVRDESLPPDPNDDPEERDVFQNETLSSIDLIARWGNPHYQAKFRFSGAQGYGFEEKDDDETSVASLLFEASVKDWNLLTRVGRQTRNTGGVLGRFDGGLLSWQATDKIRLNGVVGAPVDSRKDLPFEDDQVFYGVSMDYGPINDKWDTTLYYIDQRADDLIDRQAVGVEARFFDDYRFAFATVEYDLHFGELNTAIFSGSWTLPDKSTFTLGADYRKSPLLLTSNALQGQPLDSLRGLLGIFTEDEIDRIALDRTATSKSATIGYSRPLNEMWQINADATWFNISGTEASAGVEASPSTGDEYFYAAQLIGTSVIKEGDIFVAGVRYADRSNSDLYVLDLNARYPITREFRVNPRLRFSYRENKFDDLTEIAVLPSVRLNYYWTRNLSFEVEVGGRWSKREQDTITDEELEYFAILGVRYDFFTDGHGK